MSILVLQCGSNFWFCTIFFKPPLQLVVFKGIFSNSNNIFFWHESEDINKKAYIQNFSWFQFCVFKLCMIMCVSLTTLTTVLHKVLCPRLSGETCSHFILKWFQPNSIGEVCFLEESYKNMQKFKFWQFWERPQFDIREYAFNYAMCKIPFTHLDWHQHHECYSFVHCINKNEIFQRKHFVGYSDY